MRSPSPAVRAVTGSRDEPLPAAGGVRMGRAVSATSSTTSAPVERRAMPTDIRSAHAGTTGVTNRVRAQRSASAASRRAASAPTGGGRVVQVDDPTRRSVGAVPGRREVRRAGSDRRGAPLDARRTMIRRSPDVRRVTTSRSARSPGCARAPGCSGTGCGRTRCGPSSPRRPAALWSASSEAFRTVSETLAPTAARAGPTAVSKAMLSRARTIFRTPVPPRICPRGLCTSSARQSEDLTVTGGHRAGRIVRYVVRWPIEPRARAPGRRPADSRASRAASSAASRGSERRAASSEGSGRRRGGAGDLGGGRRHGRRPFAGGPPGQPGHRRAADARVPPAADQQRSEQPVPARCEPARRRHAPRSGRERLRIGDERITSAFPARDRAPACVSNAGAAITTTVCRAAAATALAMSPPRRSGTRSPPVRSATLSPGRTPKDASSLPSRAGAGARRDHGPSAGAASDPAETASTSSVLVARLGHGDGDVRSRGRDPVVPTARSHEHDSRAPARGGREGGSGHPVIGIGLSGRLLVENRDPAGGVQGARDLREHRKAAHPTEVSRAADPVTARVERHRGSET